MFCSSNGKIKSKFYHSGEVEIKNKGLSEDVGDGGGGC